MNRRDEAEFLWNVVRPFSEIVYLKIKKITNTNTKQTILDLSVIRVICCNKQELKQTNKQTEEIYTRVEEQQTTKNEEPPISSLPT